MAALGNYLSLIKFSHTIFAMPFAIIGFFTAVEIGGNEPDWMLFLLVITCMISARSAAMAFNRYIDRKIDSENKRTMIREIPSKVISPSGALFFVVISCVIFVVSCWFINRICFFLSPVALAVVLGYSYTKRFTSLCHLILGIGLSLAPIGAWLAVTGEFAFLPLLFSFAVLSWVGGFDIIYALQDDEFDKKQGLHSIPAAIGRKKALWVSNILHTVSAGMIVYAGIEAEFDLWYWIGATFFCGMLIYQHRLVKPNDLSKVNMAFFTSNGVASIVLCVFVLLELYA